MAISGIPKHLVIDDFLPAAFVADLLAYALENENHFEPTSIMRKVESQINPSFRQSAQCSKGLGPNKAAFKAAIHGRCNELIAGTGTPSFEIAKTELELIAHGDNAFYRSHIDTHAGPGRTIELDFRVVSCVYYFHREPKRFNGGEIALFSFGDNEDVEIIEPGNNRLVVFPSFVRHEVRAVSCPSGEFADSRFSINCWLRKEKSKPVARQGE